MPQSLTHRKTISVVTREEGSGTRDAFTELTGVLVKDGDNKTDNTTTSAVTINSTEAVITNVKDNEAAIGYISLGSLNDTVKALKIGGVEATADNVKSGDYAVSRPFNICNKRRSFRRCAGFHGLHLKHRRTAGCFR